MKDYERYMSRQRLSETGMARLLKLETEKPEKRRKPAARWMKYAGLAACLCLAVGLCALPVLRWAAQRANPQPAEEELFFHEVDYVPFTDQAIAGGMGLHTVEPGEAAELFGCAPDDFAGFLETVGLSKFDMEYYTVDMANEGDDSYRFLMKGNYISPREKPENWDEFSEISWDAWQGLSSFIPANDVWLEIYEGHSYLDEEDWKGVQPQAFQGHQVAAAWNGGYEASAAFDMESGGKTYGVLYKACTYGDFNAKELVTKMVRYLTQNGLFIENRATARVKTTGMYVMERGESDYPVMPRIAFDGERYTFGQSLLSSHLCRGGYEIANGRVTARCEQHTYVFDILDENTLRFVASESSKPVSYKGEPQITDGTVFRWEAEVRTQGLVFNQVEKVPPQVNSPYDMKLSGRLDVSEEETEMLLQAGPEDLGWAGLEVAGSSWPMGRDPDTDWPTYYFSFDGMDATVDPTCSVCLHLMPNMTDFKAYLAGGIPDWDGLTVSEINGHSVVAMSGKSHTPNFYCAAAAFVVEDVICDYGIYYAVEHVDQETAEAMVTQLVNYMTGRGVFTEMYRMHGGEGTLTLDYAELTQPYVEDDVLRPAGLHWKTQRPMTREELEAVFPACAGEAGENYIWYGTVYFEDDGNLQLVVITGDKMDETETVTITTSMEEKLTFTRNLVKENGEATYFGTDNAKYVYGADLVRCFYVNEPGHFNNASSAYYCYAQYQLTGSPLYTEVRSSVSEGSLQENEVFNTQWFDTVNKTGLWFQTGTVNGKDIWKLPEVEEAAEAVEPSGVFYLESSKGETLFYPYLNLSGNGNTFSWWRGEESSRSGSYAVANGKVRCHQSGKTYVFEAVDEDTLRFVGAESDTLDYLDADRVTRTLPDGAVLCRNDAQLGALDTTHHVEEAHHSDSHH